MKKTLSTLLTVAVTAAVAISGTLAYLTWGEGAVNVATVDNVKIEQIELQRAEGVAHNATAKEGDLVEYKQGKKLYPAYPETKDAYIAEPTDLFYWGDYVTAEGAGNGLWDDNNLNGAIDKFVFVKNTGDAAAYYRTIIALECPEGMEFSQGADKELMMNVNGNYRFDWSTVGYTTIDGTRYLLKEVVYTEVLAPGETSRPSLLQVVMTHNVTNEDVEKLGDTYDILVFSQACQVENMPEDAEKALDTAFYDVTTEQHPWAGQAVSKPLIVNTAEEMLDAFKAAGAAKAGNSTIYIANDIDASDLDWTPVYVNGYNGAGVVTVEGQGNTITGLTAPMFKGGFAGRSGIIIRDLTIADSEIESAQTQGAGAFIECVDSMETITLENCHLLNSTVDAPEARTGGLVGWTSGYSNKNDGPVKTYVTISDCSVIGCTITGTSVGAINGHAGASDWTYTTIENCTVLNNELISYDDGEWRVGAVIGTANIGEVTIKNVVAGSNVMTQEQASSQRADGLSELVGRFVPGSTGKLDINGTTEASFATTNEALKDAAKVKNATVYLDEGIYEFPALAEGVTLIGNEDVVFEDTLSGTLNNVTFKDIHISAPNAQRWAYSKGDLLFENCTFEATSVYALHFDGLGGANITYKNCKIVGWVAIGSGAEHITFEGCEIYGNGNYGVIRLYSPGTIKDCTFDVAAVNTTDVYQDGIHAVDCNIDVIDCTNVNGAVEDLFNVSGNGTITVK